MSDPLGMIPSMGDNHPTEKYTLAEIHGLGSWPVAVEALRLIGPEWVLALRRTVLAELRTLTFALEAEEVAPALLEQFERNAKVLKHLVPTTSAVPTAAPDEGTVRIPTP